MQTARIVGMALAIAVAGPVGAAEESASSAKADALTKLLDQQGLDAIAAADPDQPGRFVAALYYPGAQLLAVSAVYPAPQLLQQQIAERKYRDAYISLQVPATQNGRFFVMDLNADGLRDARGDGVFDITYENGANQVSFDGDWKRQKLSRAEYVERFRKDDARYTRILTALEREVVRASTAAAAVKK